MIPLLLSRNMPSHDAFSSEKPRGSLEPMLPASHGTGRGGVAVAVKAAVSQQSRKCPTNMPPASLIQTVPSSGLSQMTQCQVDD